MSGLSEVEGRVLMALTTSLLLAACSGPSRPCTSDEQCGGDRCDVELGACVSGAGGGSGSCEPACAQFTECEVTTCKNRYDSIAILSPSANEGATPITALADLVLALGRSREDPATLTYVVKTSAGAQVSTGTMSPVSGTQGRYTAALGVIQTGSYTFEVSGAGLTATRAFVVDTTPPTLTVDVPTRTPETATATTTYADPDTTYASAWRRDQTVSVTVRANEDLSRATVILYGTIDGGAYFTADASATTPCDAGYCGTAAIDLWQVPMNAFRATLPLRINGVDKSGNQTAVDSSVKVTRWKWEFAAGSSPVAAPAVSDKGEVIASSGGLVSCVSAAGTLMWSTDLGSASGAPSIGVGSDGGNAFAFVGASGAGNAYVYALSMVDGGTELRCPPAGSSGAQPKSVVVAKADVGSGVLETAIGAFSGTGRLAYVQPDLQSSGCAALTSSVTAGVASSNALFVGGAFHYSDVNGEIASYVPGSLTQRGGFPVGTPHIADTLLWSGSAFVASGFSTLSNGAVFFSSFDGGAAATAGVTDAGALEGLILNSSGGALVMSQKTSELLLIDSALATISAQADAGYSGALTLGRSGIVYSAGSTSSEVAAWRASDLGRLWSVSAGAGGHGSPTVDCPRDVSGGVVAGLPGVLYVPGNDGVLRAFIVDSRGLDTTAKWPKWQRDPRNSGNADVDLSQFACGP